MSQIRISNCCLGKLFLFSGNQRKPTNTTPTAPAIYQVCERCRKRYTQFHTFHASSWMQPVAFVFQLLQIRVFNELLRVAIHFHGNTICTAKDSQTFRTTKKSEQLFSQPMPSTKDMQGRRTIIQLSRLQHSTRINIPSNNVGKPLRVSLLSTQDNVKLHVWMVLLDQCVMRTSTNRCT